MGVNGKLLGENNASTLHHLLTSKNHRLGSESLSSPLSTASPFFPFSHLPVQSNETFALRLLIWTLLFAATLPLNCRLWEMQWQ